MSEIKTMNEFLRDSKSSLSRRSLLLPKGQSLLAGAFRCCASYEGVYFCYFLDPDQGQTGPVSWEVAPLPPPRPVLTLTLELSFLDVLNCLGLVFLARGI